MPDSNWLQQPGLPTDVRASLSFAVYAVDEVSKKTVFGKEADEDMPCIGVPTALDKVPGERVIGVVTNLENVHPGVNTKWFRNRKDANPRSTEDYVNSTLPKAFGRSNNSERCEMLAVDNICSTLVSILLRLLYT